jgi:hypothetical protein
MVPGGAVAYLRVEKPRFLFLGSSTGIVAAADVFTAASPDTSTARSSTSAARAASLLDYLVMGAPAPAPGAVSSAASTALGEGAQAPTSRGELVPRLSPPLPRPTTSTPKSPGRESLLLVQTELRILFFFLRVAHSCSRRCAVHARSGSRRGRIGPRSVHHHLQGTSERSDLAGAPRVNGRGVGGQKFHSPTGRGGA